ncbi:MAG: zinc ribbon domain-containing protein [Candidatus Coproplasma sp.]
MAQIQQLLKYQEADSRLLKIEQEVANCEERKKFVQTRNFLTKASEKLDQLEAKAQELKSLMDRLNDKYGEISETLKDFDNLDELVDGGADISFYKRNAQNITDKIKSLKGEIASLTSAVKEASEEYQNLKKKVITAQKQYPDLQKAFQDYKKSRQDEISSITSEMEAIAKGIDPEILKKYQAKRSERIFPIICKLTADRCSKCGIELSIAGKEAVSSGKVIECENCHRFLYSATE